MVLALHTPDQFIVDRYHFHLSQQEGKEILQKRLQLTSDGVTDIDYDFLNMIMTTKIKKGFIQIRKFIWHHLPTYRRLSLYHNSRNVHYPLCNAEDTDSQFLRCPPLLTLPSSVTLFEKLREKLRKKNIPTILSTLLLTLLRNDQPEPHPAYVTLPYQLYYNYTRAYLAQEKLWWEHFLRGRVTKTWVPILEQLFKYQCNHDDIPFNVRCQSTWKIIFSLIAEFWNHRCNVISDKFPTYEVQYLLQCVTAKYPQPPTLLQRDRYLFETTRHADASWHPEHIREWMRTVASAETDYQRHMRQTQKLLAPPLPDRDISFL